MSTPKPPTRLDVRREQAIDIAVIAAIWLWDKTLGWCAADSQRRQLREASAAMRAICAARTEKG